MTIFEGDAGANSFYGTTGDDRFYGYGGDDRFHAGIVTVNNVRTYVGAGADAYFGAEGYDTIRFDNLYEVVRLNLGGSIKVLGERDTFQGIEAFVLGSEADVITGLGENAVYVDARAGDDTFKTLQAGAFFSGGSGVNLLDLRQSDRAVTARFDIGTDGEFSLARGIAYFDDDAATVLQRINNFYGSIQKQNNIVGTKFANIIWGGDQADILDGFWGDDVIKGGLGRDHLSGDLGLDRIFAGRGNDIAFGGEDDDEIQGGSGKDELYGDGGADRLFGGTGADRLSGGTGNDILRGGGGNDVLFGDEGDDILKGESGADIIYGGAGRDEIYGGAGSDLLYSQGNGITGGLSQGSRLYGESGDDEIILDGGGGGYGGAGNDYIHGNGGRGNGYGGSGDDRIEFIAGVNDTISYAVDGGSGDDVITLISNASGNYQNNKYYFANGGTGYDILYFNMPKIHFVAIENELRSSTFGMLVRGFEEIYLGQNVTSIFIANGSYTFSLTERDMQVRLESSGNRITTGDGADNFDITGSMNTVHSGGGDDFFTAYFSGHSLFTGDGNDHVSLTSYKDFGVERNVEQSNLRMGAGDDSFWMARNDIWTDTNFVRMGQGNDTANLTGTFHGYLNMGAGDDLIQFINGFYAFEASGVIRGGAGADTYRISSEIGVLVVSDFDVNNDFLQIVDIMGVDDFRHADQVGDDVVLFHKTMTTNDDPDVGLYITLQNVLLDDLQASSFLEFI